MHSVCLKGVQMKKGEYTDGDFNMRWRFCKQTIRFWQKSKQKDERESLRVEKARRIVRPPG